MIVKPAKRPDWFTWQDPDRDWCVANAGLPGLQAAEFHGRQIVDFHISHFPCLPDGAQDLVMIDREDRFLRQPRCGLADSILRDYQQTDYLYLHDLRGALLTYEMRLGKTAVACHLHDPRSGVLLIIAPLAAREAWREWVDRTFGTGMICLSGLDASADPPGYPVYFCHYDILAAHVAFLQSQSRIGTLVLDECHLLQGKYAKRTGAVAAIAPRAGKLLGLTGTPVWNRPISLYLILHTLMPGAWGTKFEFAIRYCNAQPGSHGWTYDGISNEQELSARLRQVMVRRTWLEVMPELPPTTTVVEPVALTGAQLTAIEASAMKAALARGTSNEAGYNATLRRKMAEAKIKPAVEIARQAVADGHKVVLWTWHNEIGDKLALALASQEFGNWSLWRLQAADSVTRREQVVAEFRACDHPAFLVASMGVGGVGLDLSCSDYAIFVELDWTPAVVQQAAMRTFHKDRPHILVFLHADCPIEIALVQALDVKNGFAAALGLDAGDIARRVLP
jgi:SWI/SNF-related matrix-associated actin-dependent regulator 1 of chromatin subfamily A